MPFIPTIQGIARVRLNWSLEGNEAVNVIYFDTGVAAELSPQNCVDVCDQVYKGWHTVAPGDHHLQEQQSIGTELVSIYAEDASTPTGAFHERTVGEFGGNAGAAAPPGVAMVAKLQTLQRGRSSRGRMFIPGLPSASINGNGAINVLPEMDATMLQWLVDTQAGAGLTSLSGCFQQVASFFHGVDPVTHHPIPRATAVTLQVNNIVVDNNVHSQRRRNTAG